MSTWIILTIVLIWFVLPAVLIIAACIQSSRLSRAEEALQASAGRMPTGWSHRGTAAHSGVTGPAQAEQLRVPVHVGDGLD